MSDIIREIDEELKEDKLYTFWKKFGPWIITAAVVAILGTAISVWYDSYKKNQVEQASQLLQEAIGKAETEADPVKSAKILGDYANDALPGYKVIASFAQAKYLLDAKKIEELMRLYQSLYNDKSIPDAYRNIALLKAAMVSIDYPDQAVWIESIRTELSNLSNSSQEWHIPARELTAWMEIKKNPELAKTILQELVDHPKASSDVKERSRKILSTIVNTNNKDS